MGFVGTWGTEDTPFPTHATHTCQEMLNAPGSTGDISLLIQRSEQRLPSRVNLQEHRCQSQGEAGICAVSAMPQQGRFAPFVCVATCERMPIFNIDTKVLAFFHFVGEMRV